MAKLTISSVVAHSAMRMPTIGLGTWQSKPNEIDVALNAAIDAGYRHIDTAYAYKNERDIGNSLKKMFQSGKIRREELFIVTKLPPTGNRREDVGEYLKKSLEALQLDYVDLYLIHSPIGLIKPDSDDILFQNLELDMSTDLVELWKGMEEQVNAGRAKYIGISKFNKSQVQKIMDNCRIRPANIQNELHIYSQEKELVAFCKENDITVCAFSAFGSPGSRAWSDDARLALSPLEDPVITEIAKKYNKLPSHILIRYYIEYGVAVIPKSVNPTRIRQNINVFDFELTKEEFDRISSLDRGEKGRIFGSGFFAKHMEKELLECTLKRHWKESSIYSVLSVDTSPGATKYEAYLSTVTRLTMKVILGNGRLAKRSLILKLAQPHDKQGIDFINKYDVFKTETMMYKIVLKEMEYLMQEFEDSGGILWCNLIHDIPYSCLLLEDLKASGFYLLDKNVYFDFDHSMLAVKSLGRYHAMCKILEERGFISKDNYKKWFVFNDFQMHQLWFWNSNALKQGVKKHWHHSWVPLVDKIQLTVEGLKEKMMKLGEVNENRFNVLNHGDCHKNNIMFKQDWRGKPIEIRFLDFQIPHYGSPCCDLTFMLFLGIDPFVRREHFHELIKLYYKSLIETLERFQFSGKKPDLEQIKEDMEKFSFVGLFLILFGFPAMHMSRDIDLFVDYERVVGNEGREDYNLDLYKSESFKRTLSPDLKDFIQRFT